MAILSLVFAFVFAPAGIVLGHLAKRQIRRTGEEGDQLATWGLVLSYVFTGLGAARLLRLDRPGHLGELRRRRHRQLTGTDGQRNCASRTLLPPSTTSICPVM